MIIFGAKEERLRTSAQLQTIMSKATDKARNLMDSDLNFNSHIRSVTISAYYHLKNIARVKGLMCQQHLEKRIHAFIFSRLDYCNGVFTGIHKKSIKQLQLIQNAAARVLTNTKKNTSHDSSSEVLTLASCASKNRFQNTHVSL